MLCAAIIGWSTEWRQVGREAGQSVKADGSNEAATGAGDSATRDRIASRAERSHAGQPWRRTATTTKRIEPREEETEPDQSPRTTARKGDRGLRNVEDAIQGDLQSGGKEAYRENGADPAEATTGKRGRKREEGRRDGGDQNIRRRRALQPREIHHRKAERRGAKEAVRTEREDQKPGGTKYATTGAAEGTTCTDADGDAADAERSSRTVPEGPRSKALERTAAATPSRRDGHHRSPTGNIPSAAPAAGTTKGGKNPTKQRRGSEEANRADETSEAGPDTPTDGQEDNGQRHREANEAQQDSTEAGTAIREGATDPDDPAYTEESNGVPGRNQGLALQAKIAFRDAPTPGGAKDTGELHRLEGAANLNVERDEAGNMDEGISTSRTPREKHENGPEEGRNKKRIDPLGSRPQEAKKKTRPQEGKEGILPQQRTGHVEAPQVTRKPALTPWEHLASNGSPPSSSTTARAPEGTAIHGREPGDGDGLGMISRTQLGRRVARDADKGEEANMAQHQHTEDGEHSPSAHGKPTPIALWGELQKIEMNNKQQDSREIQLSVEQP